MAYWFGFAAVAGAFGGLIAFGSKGLQELLATSEYRTPTARNATQILTGSNHSRLPQPLHTESPVDCDGDWTPRLFTNGTVSATTGAIIVPFTVRYMEVGELITEDGDVHLAFQNASMPDAPHVLTIYPEKAGSFIQLDYVVYTSVIAYPAYTMFSDNLPKKSAGILKQRFWDTTEGCSAGGKPHMTTSKALETLYWRLSTSISVAAIMVALIHRCATVCSERREIQLAKRIHLLLAMCHSDEWMKAPAGWGHYVAYVVFTMHLWKRCRRHRPSQSIRGLDGARPFYAAKGGH
ncbi:hypothetical protein B0H14DRAFT_3435597 [Mycena olivaceomarginata]|nr:hypothetical protein B0H14DRAFT_3435597 [Mycena olivaceomarginata]